MNNYNLKEKELYEKFFSNEKGLSKEQAKKTIEKDGFNELPRKKKNSILKVFLSQFKDPLIYILIATVLISLFISEYLDAFFIFLTIFLDSVLGTIQEWQSEKNADNLQHYMKTMVSVLRDGKKIKIDSKELVVGDIVFVSSGNKVPADIRILEEEQLKVDESFLTGESSSESKDSKIIYEKEKAIGDQTNMIFAGSNILSGRAKGIVVATGIKTEIGAIAETLIIQKQTKPPLIIRMEKLSKQIGIGILITVLIFGSILFIQGTPLQEVFILAIVLAVSAIPEGLPIALTVALSIASKRMAEKNVIVRRLSTVESLGSCTLIATDKTGTLTVNKQTAKKIWLPNDITIDVPGEGYEPNDSLEYDKEDYLSLYNLITAGVITNEASLNYEEEIWKYQGDEIDIAFLTLGYKFSDQIDTFKKNIQIIGQIHYESEIAYSATTYIDDKEAKITAKGSVEKIISFCNIKNKEEIIKKAQEFSKKGYRVLALADKTIEAKHGLKEEDLINMNFLGLVAFIDPLRKESKASIKKARQAGIEVIMITGDHPLTAYSIASELELAENEEEVITGIEFESKDKEEQKKLLKTIKVFARVTPMQKLDIVELAIEEGHFVAVTGDGVNDSPALKKANIGVAMGNGSDVAKETASMIVTDNNFYSIVQGIEAGRHAYNNVRKVTYMLLATGVSEILIFIFSLLAGLPIPLIAVQLLWLNLITNGIQDVALAFEKGEPNVMQKKPRDPKEGIFNKLMFKETVLAGFVISLLAFGVWWLLLKEGTPIDEARNIVLLMMVILENVHVINSRSETISAFKIPLKNNYFLVAGILLAQLVHIAAMNFGPTKEILKLNPVGLTTWIYLFIFSIILFLVMETFKVLNNKKTN